MERSGRRPIEDTHTRGVLRHGHRLTRVWPNGFLTGKTVPNNPPEKIDGSIIGNRFGDSTIEGIIGACRGKFVAEGLRCCNAPRGTIGDCPARNGITSRVYCLVKDTIVGQRVVHDNPTLIADKDIVTVVRLIHMLNNIGCRVGVGGKEVGDAATNNSLLPHDKGPGATPKRGCTVIGKEELDVGRKSGRIGLGNERPNIFCSHSWGPLGRTSQSECPRVCGNGVCSYCR